MTYSLEEIEKTFSVEVTDEALDEVADAFREMCPPDEAVNLLGTILENLQKAAKENEDEAAAYNAMSRLDKLGYAIREAFAYGAVAAFEIAAAENNEGVESLRQKTV